MTLRFLSIIAGLTLSLSLLSLNLPPTSNSRLGAGPRPATGLTQTATAPASRSVTNVDFLGELIFETGYTYEQTEVGGLSGLAYDPANDIYYALSDDRSDKNPARFYTLTIDVADGSLAEGDITFQSVTTLTDESGEPFPKLSLDPEGIALTGQGTLFISSEGDAGATPPLDPFINEFSLEGQQLRELPVPDKFLPTADDSSGIRNNLAFESLTLSPDEKFLYTATENALAQDGPAADFEQASLSRLLKYDLATGEPVQEFVYITDPVAQTPEPADDFRANGLVELVALDTTGTFLALERSFSTGNGKTQKNQNLGIDNEPKM